MDLNIILRNARKTLPNVTTNSPVLFSTEFAGSNASPSNQLLDGSIIVENAAPGIPAPLQLGHIVDVVSIYEYINGRDRECKKTKFFG